MIPTRIILHHSLTADSQSVSWQAIRRYHEGLGWRDIGYHFGVELVGDHYEVHAGRPLNVPGAHTRGNNADSLGICLVGDFDRSPPPASQLDTTVRLVRGLMEVLHIPPERVTPHADHSSKSCPGAHFPWGEFHSALVN